MSKCNPLVIATDADKDSQEESYRQVPILNTGFHYPQFQGTSPDLRYGISAPTSLNFSTGVSTEVLRDLRTRENIPNSDQSKA